MTVDISKAFNSIDRTTFLSQLEEVFNQSEIYRINILVNEVIINVQYGMERGAAVLTKTGTCQGDCLSVIFLIIYLAKTITPLPQYIDSIDSNKMLWSELDWMINRDTHCIKNDPKYSDDINFIRS